MTKNEYKAMQQPEQWKLISAYQKANKVYKIDENSVQDMGLFYQWLSDNK